MRMPHKLAEEKKWRKKMWHESQGRMRKRRMWHKNAGWKKRKSKMWHETAGEENAEKENAA